MLSPSPAHTIRTVQRRQRPTNLFFSSFPCLCSIGIVSYHATRRCFFFSTTPMRLAASPAATDQAISPCTSPRSMLPRSLRSAARRLPAAATRAAASAASVARSPARRQGSPRPEDDGRAPQQHAAEWDDEDDLSPDGQWLRHRRMPR